MAENQPPSNKTVRKLNQSELDKLREILIKINPWQRRDFFLASISNKEISSRLRTSDIPIDQLTYDLISLNDFGQLTDGSIPFQEYLKGIASCYSWSTRASQIQEYADSLTSESSTHTYSRKEKRQEILKYYGTKDELRMLAIDIGLKPSRINFSGHAQSIAESLLCEAEKNGLVHLIDDEIKKDYH